MQEEEEETECRVAVIGDDRLEQRPWGPQMGTEMGTENGDRKWGPKILPMGPKVGPELGPEVGQKCDQNRCSKCVDQKWDQNRCSKVPPKQSPPKNGVGPKRDKTWDQKWDQKRYHAYSLVFPMAQGYW